MLTSTLLVSFSQCWLNWKSSHRHPVFFLTSCPDIKAKITLLKLRKQCFTTAKFPPWISPAKGWKTRAFEPFPRRLCNRRGLQIWCYFPQTLSRVIGRQRLKNKIWRRLHILLEVLCSGIPYFLNAGVNVHMFCLYNVQKWICANCSLAPWQKAMLRSGSFMGIVQRGMQL